MCDADINPGLVEDHRLTRRGFGLAAAVASLSGTAALAQANVTEREVEVKTPDGTCDAVLFHPNGAGAWPAVLIWTDIMGLRQAHRDMGRRLASQGYVVLVPNPFYRSSRAPVVGAVYNFNTDAELRARLLGYRAAMSDSGIDGDAVAYLNFLDAQPQTDKTKKAGVHGYCMGGPLSFRTAAMLPGRIAAVGSFHGGNGLVTQQPNSPHLLIARTNATFLICHAQNDDAQVPQMKEDLRAAFAAARRTATVEVHAANHGWCVRGSQAFDEAESERAWGELSKLYQATLV